MKKVLSVILCVAVFAASFVFLAAAEEEKEDSHLTVQEDGTVICTQLTDSANFIFEGGSGTITIVPATLYENGTEKNIYLVGAMGMGYNLRKPNNPFTAFLTGFNIRTPYFTAVKNAIMQNIPVGSKLLYFGHSQGGMVGQQIMTDEDITGHYDVLKVVTIGSPYIMVRESKREGKLVRFADKYDAVPRLTPALFLDPLSFSNMTVRDGGYTLDPDGAHNLSYRFSDVWNAFDATGTEGGSSYFVYDPAKVIPVL